MDYDDPFTRCQRGERTVWVYDNFKRDVHICNSASFILTFHTAVPVDLSNLQCDKDWTINFFGGICSIIYQIALLSMYVINVCYQCMLSSYVINVSVSDILHDKV